MLSSAKLCLVFRAMAILIAYLIVSMPFVNASMAATAMGSINDCSLAVDGQRFDYNVNGDLTGASLHITNTMTGETRLQEFTVSPINKKEYIDTLVDEFEMGRLASWFLKRTLPKHGAYYHVVATENGSVLYDTVTISNPLLPVNASAVNDSVVEAFRDEYSVVNRIQPNSSSNPGAVSAALGDQGLVQDQYSRSPDEVRVELQEAIDEVKRSPDYDATVDDEDPSAYLDEFMANYTDTYQKNLETDYADTSTVDASEHIDEFMGKLSNYMDTYSEGLETGNYYTATTSRNPSENNSSWTYAWNGITFRESNNKSEVYYPHPDYGTYNIKNNDTWNEIKGENNFSAIHINREAAFTMVALPLVIIIAVIPGLIVATVPTGIVEACLVPLAELIGPTIAAAMTACIIPIGHLLGTTIIWTITVWCIAQVMAALIVIVVAVLIVVICWVVVALCFTDERGGVWTVYGPDYLRVGGHTIYNKNKIPNP